MTDGVLLVDKPAGITSHDVVARARRRLRAAHPAPAVKVGHAHAAPAALPAERPGEEREREHRLLQYPSFISRPPRLFVVAIASHPEFDLRRAFEDPTTSLKSIAELFNLQDYDGTKGREILHAKSSRISATYLLALRMKRINLHCIYSDTIVRRKINKVQEKYDTEH